MKNLTLFFFAVLFIIACQKEETKIIRGSNGKINLSSLEVGQQSRYVRYSATCQFTDNLNITLGIDTLVVDIIENNRGTFTFAESFTKGSNFYQTGNTDETLYSVTPENNYILIPDRDSSTLFWFYGNDTLHLQPENLIPTIQFDCYLINGPNDFFRGNEITILEKFAIGDIILENKYAVSCLPVSQSFQNLDGYLLYDENNLYVSQWIVNVLDMTGWVDIDETF